MEFDGDEIDDIDDGEEGTGLDRDDMIALGVVGLIVWLLMRSKAGEDQTQDGQEVVTSRIEYPGF